jgi:hypothetical protein
MLGHSIVSQHFMEPEGSIPNSQELSTCSYPEPDQSSIPQLGSFIQRIRPGSQGKENLLSSTASRPTSESTQDPIPLVWRGEAFTVGKTVGA